MTEAIRLVLPADELDSAHGETPQETVRRLAELSPLDYDHVREAEAKQLGIRVGTLDAEVNKLRSQDGGPEEVSGAFLKDPDPWHETVDGGELIARIAATAKTHIVLPPGADVVIALWILLTHVHDAFDVSPILCVTSAAPSCGKSTSLTLLSALVSRALPASNITPAVVFRAIDKWHPTLLIDEADSFLRDNEELRGILNSGHGRANAYVIRTVGENYEPMHFSTWSAKAIALIGKLPATLASRAIHIELRRMKADEHVEPLRLDRLDHLKPLMRQAVRWAADNAEALRSADPELPEGLYGRPADNWRPLFAIADLAGGGWPERARSVAEKLNAEITEQTAGIVLLEDVRAIFTERAADRLTSVEMIEALVGMEHRPWPEWKMGKPITPRQLAKLLEPFGVTPTSIRTATGKTPKGYHLDAFDDAFSRFLPSESATPPQPAESLAFCESLSATTIGHVADMDRKKPQKLNACGGVADKKPLEASFGDADPFASLKDDSLKLKPRSDDYPDLPGFLERRAAR